MSVGITLAQLTRFYDEAMAAEGFSPYKRQRVANRVVWGHPDGYQDVRRAADRDEVLDPVAMDVVAQAAARAGAAIIACQLAPKPSDFGTVTPADEAAMRGNPNWCGAEDDGTVLGTPEAAKLIAEAARPACRYCGEQIERAAAQRGPLGWATTNLNIDGPWYCKSVDAPDHRHEPLGDQ